LGISLEKYASGLGSTKIQKVLRFNVSHETGLSIKFVAQKQQDANPFWEWCGVCFTTLAAETL